MTDNHQIYHIIRTVTDFRRDKSGCLRSTDILGTYSDLAVAKATARKALTAVNSDRDWYTEYHENDGQEDWVYGDGVLVHALAPGGEIFQVSIETRPHHKGLKSDENGRIQGDLYHVIQTKVDYNADRAGAIQTTEIEGTYTTREKAEAAARKALLDEEVTKDSFLEYNEQTDETDWPYGDDVIVHAISPMGENFQVSVVKEGEGLLNGNI